MSGIELKPISESEAGRSNFLLPLGKTVIGRGPVLGVSDKRVSRNHGLVEVEDGKVKIMSTHTNPTFYQAKGTARLLPLPKEVWQSLEHGDRISLTPDQHVYEVVIDERPYHKGSQSLGSITDSPVKESPVKESPQKMEKHTEDAEDDRGRRENNRKEIVTGVDEKNQLNSTDGRTKKIKSDEDKERDGTEDHEKDDAEEKQDAGPPSTQIQSKGGTVKLPGQKEMALPVERERKLPDWMAKLGGGTTTAKAMSTPTEASRGRGRGRGRPRGTSTTTASATQRTATPKRSKKQPSVSDEASEEEYSLALQRTPSRGRGRPRGKGRGKAMGRGRPRRHQSDDDDDDDDDEEVPSVGEEEEEIEEGPRRWGHGKTRDQATVKRRAKVAMDYSEDFAASGEDEEEEELPVPEGDDGSDWEPESHSPRLMRTSSKGKRTSGRKKTGGRRYSRQSSEEDSDLSEEEVYIPRPTKRSGRAVSSSLEIDSQDMPRKRTKKTDNGKKRREPCRYGKKCYRKNPLHKEEFAHPGDSDCESAKSDDGDDDDDGDEKEECPHGTTCYSNPC
ncbi:aprataxin and PNK-like factor isoform X2 [Acanthaster planci]|uniref:Aprataxin and PNK-like factor isoform X2 n=1 Tax=Acanthaster planci TaxID=133434 RepID=A0A8B7YXU5_ACAPL|nr:aprataxin and PNK-like factor isoform X2 [Acanthaster planci]